MYSQGKMRIITYDIQVVKIDIYLQTGKYFYFIYLFRDVIVLHMYMRRSLV